MPHRKCADVGMMLMLLLLQGLHRIVYLRVKFERENNTGSLKIRASFFFGESNG